MASSLHHMATSINFEDIMFTKNYEIFAAYAQSKLANILFTRELQKRLSLRGSRVVCNSVHPGCVRTEVTRNMSWLMRLGNALFAPLLATLQKTSLQGANTIIHVAIAPNLGNDAKTPSLSTDDLNKSFQFSDVTEKTDDDDGSPDVFGQKDYMTEEVIVGGGLHYFHCQPIEVSAAATNETAIRLWMRSEELTGLAH